MFMGEFNHSIDPKNRVIVPAKFREGLGENFVVSAGLDGCLYMWTYADWESFVMKLEELPFTRETRELQRFFTQNASELEFDKQGRIIIPQELKSYAGIEKELVTMGAMSKIEIWSKEVWENPANNSKMDTEDFANALEEYNF